MASSPHILGRQKRVFACFRGCREESSIRGTPPTQTAESIRIGTGPRGSFRDCLTATTKGTCMGFAVGRVARAAALTPAVVPGLALADMGRVNLQVPVTRIAEQIYDMHTLMLLICLVIFIGVFGVMFWAIFNHRRAKGAVAAHFHENTAVEIVWTIVPVFILLGMAYPATKTVLAMKDTSNPDITIKATGYQWKWGYDYIKGEGEGIQFFSALSTPREQIVGQAAKGANYLLEVDKTPGGAGGQEDPNPHHGRRRHPFLVGAGLRRQAGCDPGLHPRHLVPGGQGRRLSRQLRGTVRQGPRLHAHRSACAVGREIFRLGCRAESEDGR